MDFTDRLLAIMNHYGHNKNSFSVAIGASNNSVIGRLVNERERRPSFDLIGLILKRYPALNPTWLILGEGTMFLDRPEAFADSKDRLMHVCDLLKIDSIKISEACGISRQDAQAVRDGKQEASEDCLQKICDAFPVIRPSWLIHNEGSMFIDSVDPEKFIPFLEDVPVGATVEDIKRLPASFVSYTSRVSLRDTRQAFGVRNLNNDFAPNIMSGDYLLVKVVDVKDVIPSDLVYVTTDKRNYFRRVAEQTDNGKQSLTLIDNMGIKYEIPKADIRMIGVVMSLLRMFAS